MLKSRGPAALLMMVLTNLQLYHISLVNYLPLHYLPQLLIQMTIILPRAPRLAIHIGKTALLPAKKGP